MARELKLVTVIGNPKAGSRTLSVGAEAARQIGDGLKDGNTSIDHDRIDIAEIGPALLDWENQTAKAAVARAVNADLLVVASPTYKATYTGLLKLFLDLMPHKGLTGTVAVPLMVAAAPVHGLAVETYLRPLLVELGASCPTQGIFIAESALDDIPAAIAPWTEGALPLLAAALVGK